MRLGWLEDLYLHRPAGNGQHVDKRIDSKLINMPVHKVVDARLVGTEKGSGFALCHFAPPDVAFEFKHQVGADLQVGCFILAVAEGLEQILVWFNCFHTCLHIRFYGDRLDSIRSLYRLLPFSRSCLAVFCVFFWKACST